jgi:hypothetical protein
MLGITTRLVTQKILRGKSLFLEEEWMKLKDPPVAKAPRAVERWCPAGEGWHKANVDGAFHAGSGTGGCEVILRNHHREFLAGTCHVLPSALDGEHAEALACKGALELAMDQGSTKVRMESD